jgi:hypothetical protein
MNIKPFTLTEMILISPENVLSLGTVIYRLIPGRFFDLFCHLHQLATEKNFVVITRVKRIFKSFMACIKSK